MIMNQLNFMNVNEIYQGDCLDVLKIFPDECINCVVTSPPYWGLRDYGINGQIGLEKTPEEYTEKIVKIFNEIKRVLKKDGTIWLNLGDSYASTSKNRSSEQSIKNSTISGSLNTQKQSLKQISKICNGLKPKQLIGIPWRIAFALQANDWYLRQDIIWYKRNPMPESVTDRCTRAHEYIFLLSKSQKYYFDQESIKQPITDNTILRITQQIEKQEGSKRIAGRENRLMKAVGPGPGRNPRKSVDIKGGNQGNKKGIPAMAIHGRGVAGHSGYFNKKGELIGDGKANKKDVWEVTTKPFKESHFAVYPSDLIVDCIKAGCPEGGIVLDPFAGTNTTGIVARKLNRNFIAIELNPKYIELAKKRMYNELGMFP